MLFYSLAAQCRLGVQKGPCEAAHTLWYFDAFKGMCETFLYGGCEGNENRFLSREDCQAACLADIQGELQ